MGPTRGRTWVVIACATSRGRVQSGCGQRLSGQPPWGPALAANVVIIGCNSRTGGLL